MTGGPGGLLLKSIVPPPTQAAAGGQGAADARGGRRGAGLPGLAAPCRGAQLGGKGKGSDAGR